MKIVIAPDSFKGCLRAAEVCEYLKQGVLRAAPAAEVLTVPMADGGEGTVDAAIAATGGVKRKVRVTGPRGTPVDAEYGVLGNGATAIMEMASAAGIELVPANALNPMKATTRGVGELIAAILDAGIRDIVIGVGGSATVEGGVGMAQALGYRLLDAAGRDIAPGGQGLRTLQTIDTSGADPRLRQAHFTVATDVTNPLLGERGAARVYGPQKGAGPDMVEQLEQGLSRLGDLWLSLGLLDTIEKPGDGAAGGLGAGLRAFCGAVPTSGAEALARLAGLREKMEGADLVITGEGQTDAQTASGKLCAVIAAAAAERGAPVLLLSGALRGDFGALQERFTAAFSVATGPCSLAEALKSAPENLRFAAENAVRLFLRGKADRAKRS